MHTFYIKEWGNSNCLNRDIHMNKRGSSTMASPAGCRVKPTITLFIIITLHIAPVSLVSWFKIPLLMITASRATRQPAGDPAAQRDSVQEDSSPCNQAAPATKKHGNKSKPAMHSAPKHNVSRGNAAFHIRIASLQPHTGVTDRSMPTSESSAYPI